MSDSALQIHSTQVENNKYSHLTKYGFFFPEKLESLPSQVCLILLH